MPSKLGSLELLQLQRIPPSAPNAHDADPKANLVPTSINRLPGVVPKTDLVGPSNRPASGSPLAHHTSAAPYSPQASAPLPLTWVSCPPMRHKTSLVNHPQARRHRSNNNRLQVKQDLALAPSDKWVKFDRLQVGL
jgi:hypothetical protein